MSNAGLRTLLASAQRPGWHEKITRHSCCDWMFRSVRQKTGFWRSASSTERTHVAHGIDKALQDLSEFMEVFRQRLDIE